MQGWVPVDVTKGTAGSGYVEDDSNTESSEKASEQTQDANQTTPDTAQTQQTTKQGQKTHLTTSNATLNLKQVLGLQFCYLSLQSR